MNLNVRHHHSKLLLITLIMSLFSATYFLFTCNLNADENDIQALQIEKLKLENEKLKNEISIGNSRWTNILKIAPFVTSIVALIGAFLTIWKYLKESYRQKEIDKQNLAAERTRRFDENFYSIVKGLESTSPIVKAGSAISLLTFLKSEYSEFHDQVYYLVEANLKVKQDKLVHDALIKVFEKAISLKSYKVSKQNEKISDEKIEEKIIMNLSLCNLSKARLNSLCLDYANFENATLIKSYLNESSMIRLNAKKSICQNVQASRANFWKAFFNEAKLQGANFGGANLQMANFTGSIACGAQFRQAKLQSAIFNKCDLRGAKFEQANLNNTQFKDILFNDSTLRSIIKSHHWHDKAHFDQKVKDQLVKIQEEINVERENKPNQ